MNVVTLAALHAHCTVFKSFSGNLKVDMSDERAFFGEFIQAQIFSKQIEGFKAIFTVSTICSVELGIFAKPEVASQNYARSCVDLSSYRMTIHSFLRRFSKPEMALQCT